MLQREVFVLQDNGYRRQGIDELPVTRDECCTSWSRLMGDSVDPDTTCRTWNDTACMVVAQIHGAAAKLWIKYGQ